MSGRGAVPADTIVISHISDGRLHHPAVACRSRLWRGAAQDHQRPASGIPLSEGGPPECRRTSAERQHVESRSIRRAYGFTLFADPYLNGLVDGILWIAARLWKQVLKG